MICCLVSFNNAYLHFLQFMLANLDPGIHPLEWSEDKYLSSLSFNEDFQTRPWWSPSPNECYLSSLYNVQKLHSLLFP